MAVITKIPKPQPYTLESLRAHLVEAFEANCCIVGNATQAVRARA